MLSIDKVHGIPRLQNHADITESDRFLLVSLQNSAGTCFILALDRANANLVGYLDATAYFFPDTNEPYTFSVFAGLQCEALPLNSSYTSIEDSLVGRGETLSLSVHQLDVYMQRVYDSSSSSEYKNNADYYKGAFVLQVTQLISEAIRYRCQYLLK